MRKILFITLCWFPSCFLSALSPEVAQNIFEELLDAIGDRKTNPTLTFAEKNETDQLAKYYPLQNNITIHKNLLTFADEFGEKNKTVIALVLSHELAHHFGNHQQRHGFVGADGRKLQEAEADKFSIFFSYLAGYPTQDLDASFLKKLYQKFNISDSNHYPSLADRIIIYEEARKELHDLFVMFEAGNLLLLLNQYETAAKCFDQIGLHFQSPEILTNAGVSYALAALNLFDQSELAFLFPLEFEEETKLPQTRGTHENYSDQEIAFLQNHYLSLAEVQFKLVLIHTPSDANAYHHLASVYMLQAFLDRTKFSGERTKILKKLALKEISTSQLFSKNQNQNTIILQGIFSALENDTDQAKIYFQQAIDENDDELAKRNLCILEKNCAKVKRKKTIPCEAGEHLGGLSLGFDEIKKVEDFIMSTSPISISHVDRKIEILKKEFISDKNDQVIAWMVIDKHFSFEKETLKTYYLLETTNNYSEKTCLEISLGDSKEKLKNQYGQASEVKNSRTTAYYKYKNNLILFGLNNNTITKIINYKIE